MDWFGEAEDRLTQWKTREKRTRDFRDAFTPLARKTLDAALREAQDLNFFAIGAEHLLIALLQLGERPVSRVFAGLGLSPETLRTEVKRMQGHLPEKWTPDRLPFTPRLKRILRTARREAEAQGRSFVDIEHLLLGLLEEKEGVPAELFRNLGINVNVLRDRVLTDSPCT